MSKMGIVILVSFRHLAMLAQVKSDDEILEIVGSDKSGKLVRMRNWINGPHFPEELRIAVLEEPYVGLDANICEVLRESLTNCEWVSESIGEAISNSFKNNEISPREGYRMIYLAILEKRRGRG